ncbi:phosphatase PAP2 family protein [Tenacibaculum agarivorans]|uniref:phosphatase PAP2 family protein n=1 Tax=Tenacibaculum agarivorans TaxID=1908389 RepID=UPI00094BB316|nr:phosphatase PAP2 family protein [Tenacibaculum agarivorans]
MIKKISKFIFIFLFIIKSQLSFAQQELTSTEKFHETTGDVLVGLLPALSLTSTFIWKDGQKGTLQFSKSLVSTIAITWGMKLLIDKERPNGESLNSFPSGHTSISFASAAFIQKRYGWKYGAPAYVLAGYVGFSRIQANKHDGWDVLAGAIIGTGMSYIFTKPFDKESNLKFSTGLLDNTPTLKLTYTFK